MHDSYYAGFIFHFDIDMRWRRRMGARRHFSGHGGRVIAPAPGHGSAASWRYIPKARPRAHAIFSTLRAHGLVALLFFVHAAEHEDAPFAGQTMLRASCRRHAACRAVPARTPAGFSRPAAFPAASHALRPSPSYFWQMPAQRLRCCRRTVGMAPESPYAERCVACRRSTNSARHATSFAITPYTPAR